MSRDMSQTDAQTPIAASGDKNVTATCCVAAIMWQFVLLGIILGIAAAIFVLVIRIWLVA